MLNRQTARRRNDELKHLADFHNKVLSKLESADALTTFMDSKGGKRLLSSFTREFSQSRDRILGSVQAGILLSFGGLSMIILDAVYDFGERAVFAIGALVMAVGLGFLVSATVSYYLSQRWGLLAQPRSLDNGSDPDRL